MPYQPIENHGIIGHMRTAALVGLNGSIDWLRFPRFDSPSVFAAILDDKKGGYFKLPPCGRTKALARRTPSFRRCIRDTPSVGIPPDVPRGIWLRRWPHQ